MSEERETLVTPSGKILFHKNLFEQNEKGRFKASLLFNKSQDLKKIKDLMLKAAKEKFKKEIYQSKKFSWGMKTPDEDGIRDYDFFSEDVMVLNASTKFEVEVKSAKKGPDGKNETLIESDLKAGDICRFLISVYAWEYEDEGKKRGVSLNLMAVQKIKDGEALYARIPSDEFFDEVEIDVSTDEEETTEGSTEQIDGDDAMEW